MNPGETERSRTEELKEKVLHELRMTEQLEDEATPLETSFSLYERGMALVKEINSRIDRSSRRYFFMGHLSVRAMV